MIPGNLMEQLREALVVAADKPLPPPKTHAEQLRREAVAYQKHALTLLRQADAEEFGEELDAASAAARDARDAAAAEVERLAGAVTPAIGAARAAEDRAIAAAGHARLMAEEEKTLSGSADAGPEEKTEALVRRRAAEDVAAREQSAFEGALAVRAQAEADLAAARDVLAARKADAERALGTMNNPGRAPVSVWTALLEPRLTYLTLAGSLTDTEMGFVALAAGELAKWTGANRAVIADAVREAGEKAAGRPGLVPGRSPQDMTVVEPGSRAVPGGVVSPGHVPSGGRGPQGPVLTPQGPFRRVP